MQLKTNFNVIQVITTRKHMHPYFFCHLVNKAPKKKEEEEANFHA